MLGGELACKGQARPRQRVGGVMANRAELGPIQKQGDYGMAKRKMSSFERLRKGEKLSRRERRALERCL